MHLPRASVPSVAAPVDCAPTIAVCAVFASLAWIAVSLRIWTKLRVVRTSLGWDDRTMVIALMFLTVYCGAVIDISTRVTATHNIVSWNDLLISINLLNVTEIFYVLSILALKVSLALFFLRLTSEPWQRKVIWSAFTVSTVFSIAMFFFVVFQCGVYGKTITFIERRLGSQCASNASTLGMTYTHGAISTLTDWTFLVMPFFILRHSLMNRNEKWTVGAILCFASVGAIASIVRFKFILGLAVPKAEFFVNAKDIAIWSCIEPGIGIIAGSVVTLRPLIRLLVDILKSRGSYSGSRFPRRPSHPYIQNEDTPSSVHLHDPEPVYLGHQDSIEDLGLVDEKTIVVTRKPIVPPTQKRRGSGLPLNLFGSIRSSRSKASSSLNSDQTSSSRPAPSFIWRSTTESSSEKDSEKEEKDDDAKTVKTMRTMASSKIRPSPLRQEARQSEEYKRRSEEYKWLEEQLDLEQPSPISAMFPTSPTMSEIPRRQLSRGSEKSRRILGMETEWESPQVPVSPLGPQSASWRQSRSEDSRQPVSPMVSSHTREQSQGSVLSRIRARMSNVPEMPEWQRRTSEDSFYPSTLMLDELRRLERAPMPAAYPPRTSSHQSYKESDFSRFEDDRPQTSPIDPSSSQRSSRWEAKPLPRPPPVERKPLPRSILKRPPPPPPELQAPPKRKEVMARSSGLPLNMFGSHDSEGGSNGSSL